MATYAELRSLFSEDDLRQAVVSASVIAAEAAITAVPGSPNGRALGLAILQSPESWGRTFFYAVLAANKDATSAAIKGASDSTVQSAVDGVFDSIANALAGA